MAKKENTLIHYVQLHERAWGTQTYPKRPDLADILNAEVVVFWQTAGDERWTITLHENLTDVERHLTRLLMRQGIDAQKKTIARIFQNGERLIITGVRVKFEKAPD